MGVVKVKAGSGLGFSFGDVQSLDRNGDIRCVKDMYMLKLVSGEINSGITGLKEFQNTIIILTIPSSFKELAQTLVC